MNKPLSVTEVLGLLDTLKGVLQDFTAQEDKLASEFRAKKNAETRAFEVAVREQTSRHTTEVANCEAGFEAAKQQRQARFASRKIRINEAHKRARKRAVEKVTEQEGRRKHKIQQNSLEGERKRQAELANAAASLETFKQNLGENSAAFARHEQSAYGAFAGFRKFRKMLGPTWRWPEPDVSAANEDQILGSLQTLENQTAQNLGRFRRRFFPLLFRYLPLWLLLVLVAIGLGVLVPVLERSGIKIFGWREAGMSFGGALVTLVVIHQLARYQSESAAREIAGNLAKARRLADGAYQKAELSHRQEQARIQQSFQGTTQRLEQDWKLAVKEAIDLKDLRPRQIDEQAGQLNRKHEQLHLARSERIEGEHTQRLAQLERQGAAQKTKLEAEHAANIAGFDRELNAHWANLQNAWTQAIKPVFEAFQKAKAAANELFPDWEEPSWKDWKPPQEFRNAAKFGQLEIALDKLADSVPKDPRLSLPVSNDFSVPLLLTYPREGSILLETSKSGAEEALSAMNNIIFRLLASTPPGKLSFTIFDPVGLGQSFAGVMHLADYEESHINSRIWTQTTQFEEKLSELNEHMEKVIQMYLRNEYETIAEYNAQAGTIAEKYHILVVASFPVNFSDTAMRRLRNIAASGARCGVYTLLHWDQRHPVPHDFVPDELRKNSINLVRTERGFELPGRRMPGTRVILDPPPSPEFATNFLHQVGDLSKDSNRVEVPFSQVAPPDSELWTEETTEELRVPIGRSGATKLQTLAIGKGTRQHALIAGKTGSGKSTLFHVIITNLSLWSSPEQVEFYLVDFKKGVEFKCYANRRLPHARVIAIESDRQFGLSVLERVDMELRRRGDLFRALGVQDLPGYKRAGGTETVPRSLLLIDEFQEFFVEEDRISQSAAVLLDRIVRQGRAFGIHVLLGSQTLGGAYTLARATIGQMVIRIALQCNEADAYLIMDQDNPAPRLLSRPGEGIYNDEAGGIEGNSPFQAVWLADDLRDTYLEKVRRKADASGKNYPGPFVFEGNAPADVRENAPLNGLLGAPSVQSATAPRIWLGAPNSIKGPTEVVFQKQSANNLLVVGQNEESSLILLCVGLISLAAQYPVGKARYILLDSTAPESAQRELLDRVIHAVPHEIVQARNRDLGEIMGELAADLGRRSEGQMATDAPPTFVLIHALQNYKRLKQEDDFSFSSSSLESGPQPAAILLNLLSEGPSHGLHVLTTCDTYNNVTRFLGRKNLSEFAMRVLFQMSASDSASLIDNPDAGTLGLHRALLYNDREGYLEMFRPYARPGNDWIDFAAQNLRRLLSTPLPATSG